MQDEDQQQQQQQSVDSAPSQGEITEAMPRGSALDGNIMPAAAVSAGMFVDLLEDGEFSADAYREVRALAQQMTDISRATGGKTKGRVTLTIDLTKDGEAFTVQGKVAVKAPELPRPKSIMWTDDQGAFTRFPPNQTQMFGISRAPLRNV